MPTLEMMTLTNPKNGQTVETPYTDAQAFELFSQIQGRDRSFVQSILDASTRKPLSPGQLFWVHKLAVQHNKPAEPDDQAVQHIGDFTRLTRMFHFAVHYRPEREEQVRKARKLRILLETPLTGTCFQLSLAGDNSKYAGQLMISDGNYNGTWYGRINKDGNLFPRPAITQEITDLLLLFAQNPIEVARQYGHKTGRCCFCGRKVKDEAGDAGTQKGSSVEQGFGLVCARRYGMYHTNLRPLEKEEYWAREGREAWME